MKLAAFRESELTFEPTVLQIEPQRNEGKSLLGGSADQFANLTAIQQELARAERIVIRIITVRVRADMTVEQPNLTALDQTVSVFEIYVSVPGRLDLGSCKNNACLEPFKDFVVVKGLTVDREFFGHLGIVPGVVIVPGVPPTVPGPVGC